MIPEQLADWEVAHRGLTELEIVGSMHERKARMFDLSDGFVALPGGFGTMEEIFEMLTWRQLGIGNKPCAFLDVDGFYAPLIGMIDRMVEERFLHPEQRHDLWHGERHRRDAGVDARLPAGAGVASGSTRSGGSRCGELRRRIGDSATLVRTRLKHGKSARRILTYTALIATCAIACHVAGMRY